MSALSPGDRVRYVEENDPDYGTVGTYVGTFSGLAGVHWDGTTYGPDLLDESDLCDLDHLAPEDEELPEPEPEEDEWDEPPDYDPYEWRERHFRYLD